MGLIFPSAIHLLQQFKVLLYAKKSFIAPPIIIESEKIVLEKIFFSTEIKNGVN